MSVQLKGNFIFAQPGEKCYKVSSNFVNYLQLGDPLSSGFYLEAKIEQNKFVVSSRLFDRDRNLLCEIRENHLEDKTPGCRFAPLPSGGYRIYDSRDRVVIELNLLEPNVCVLKGEFYSSDGQFVARGDDEDLKVFRGPAILGKAGSAYGIVLQ